MTTASNPNNTKNNITMTNTSRTPNDAEARFLYNRNLRQEALEKSKHRSTSDHDYDDDEAKQLFQEAQLLRNELCAKFPREEEEGSRQCVTSAQRNALEVKLDTIHARILALQYRFSTMVAGGGGSLTANEERKLKDETEWMLNDLYGIRERCIPKKRFRFKNRERLCSTGSASSTSSSFAMLSDGYEGLKRCNPNNKEGICADISTNQTNDEVKSKIGCDGYVYEHEFSDQTGACLDYPSDPLLFNEDTKDDRNMENLNFRLKNLDSCIVTM